MIDRVLVRPMTAADAAGVYHMSSEALPETTEEREEIQSRSAEEVERRKDRYLHFLDHDPEGAWVAADGERIVGVALALAREGVWILSLFAVDEEYRSAGVGKELLGRALGYAEGCKGAMLASSTHPAAMRRYALAGFDLHADEDIDSDDLDDEDENDFGDRQNDDDTDNDGVEDGMEDEDDDGAQDGDEDEDDEDDEDDGVPDEDDEEDDE